MTNWDTSFKEWKSAIDCGSFSRANKILNEARKSIPRSKGPHRWDWFISALEASDSAGFVMAVFANHPIPSAMKDAVLSAGVKHGNASTIKLFVVPCIETFGLQPVKDWLDDCGNPRKAAMAEYWFHFSEKTKRFDPASVNRHDYC